MIWWNKFRIVTDIVGVAVLSALTVVMYRRHQKGYADAWRLIPVLLLGDTGAVILLLNNLAVIPTKISAVARWAGMVCVLLSFFLVGKEWWQTRGKREAQ